MLILLTHFTQWSYVHKNQVVSLNFQKNSRKEMIFGKVSGLQPKMGSFTVSYKVRYKTNFTSWFLYTKENWIQIGSGN